MTSSFPPYSTGSRYLVEEIRELKHSKNAAILAHYYMTPELQLHTSAGGIADVVGDSLALSRAATTIDAEVIVFCGVAFMAETAKILNPQCTVLLPDRAAGCSLASSITAQDVQALRKRHPNTPVMAYINTYAETKAESDICCTSRNAIAVAASFPQDTLIFVPDLYMGRNISVPIAQATGKKLILWNGVCEVHEQFTAARLAATGDSFPDAEILVHWEVPSDAAAIALARHKGIIGSTSDIIRYVEESTARQFILGSECDLGAALRGMYADREFITPCVYCPHMKRITLHNTLEALQAVGSIAQPAFEVILEPDIQQRAFLPLQRMIEIG